MKTAYELAMERLGKNAPVARLTANQKKQLAELDSKYAAKVAEREISLQDAIAKAAGAGEFEKVDELKQRLINERKAIQAELQDKKEQIRKNGMK